MTEFTDSMVAVANDLIPTFGEVATFNRGIPGNYDPTTGEVINSLLTFQAYAVRSNYSEYEINNTVILKGDVRIIVQPITNQAPAIGDTITLRGIDYRIMNVSPTVVSGIDLIYECQVRV